MNKVGWTAALFCCVTTGAMANGFSYKGVKLGDSMEQFQQALPHFECRGEHCTYSRDRCAPVTARGSTADFTRRLDECREGTSFGGALVTYGRVTFIEGKIAQIYLTSPWMKQIDEVLVAKFGNPSFVDTAPVRSKVGVEYPNWIKTWNLGSEKLTAALRASSINEGSVLISGAAMQEREKSLQRERIQSGAKDF